MKNLLTLTRVRILLTMRNKMFVFFSVIMPFGFFFLYAGIFAKGDPRAVSFFLGPVIALTVMGSFWGLSAALVTYRERGILRRFHVAPVSAADLLASSIIATFILTIPIAFVELLLAHVLFRVDNLGNILSATLLITLGTISFGSLGLLVSSITNTMQETQVINQILWLPLIFLSGATFPLAFLPNVVQKFSLFLPATYLVQGLQAAVFRNVEFWNLPVELGSLAFWAAITFFLSTQLFRWEAEAKVPRRAKLMAVATAIPFLLLGVWENQYGRIPTQAQAAFRSLASPENSSPPHGPRR
ncbi:MAG: ABC transporter permease [Steroidobacteraceae bacterium]